MKVNVLSLVDGSVVVDAAAELSFGTVHRGAHCPSPVLIRVEKTTENNILGMTLFLQDLGGLTGSSFGYYVSSGFTGGIDYTNLLTSHFVLEEGATGPYPAAGYSGVELGITGGQFSDLAWLDVEIDGSAPVGLSQANYRFVYDYN
jgi:hypothetical protein